MCSKLGPQEFNCMAVTESRGFVGFKRSHSESTRAWKAQREKIGSGCSEGGGRSWGPRIFCSGCRTTNHNDREASNQDPRADQCAGTSHYLRSTIYLVAKTVDDDGGNTPRSGVSSETPVHTQKNTKGSGTGESSVNCSPERRPEDRSHSR